ncbi:PLP-dependent aminotransferase family protein [Brevibacterium aurantiacum]|uniref:PLP-dependent aminotransferase family protein n=1 Tax=Brevibacterium aurantiacum TaxID=273384 RepID=A0A556CQL8_BREAU|nr:PLP-dependent aminotransferase family protein [Brevibacterium aurantiacum]TSI19722.1 PLP-dependent aminotransferase family protein [Brevibacterium aurantiacum]
MPRAPREVHLPIVLDQPRSAALVDAVIELISERQLGDADWLPSSRALAHQLSCSRTLVETAYAELIAAGYLETFPGSGTRVAEGAANGAAAGVEAGSASAAGGPRHLSGKAMAEKGPTSHEDLSWRSGRSMRSASRNLRPGRPDTALVDMRAWAASVKRAAVETAFRESPRDVGNPTFASAMAEHLRRHRGISAESIVTAPGSAHVFAAIAELAHARGLRRCYMEAPCYGAAYEEMVRAGFDVLPVGVDEDGLQVGELPSKAGLVYVTPAHQYPLGYRMSVPRRAELIAWAGRTGSIIIEDDYDGEFRFGVPPLPALRSMRGAGDCVVYVGTSSKVLSPSLALAWAVPPAEMFDELADFMWDRRLVANPVIATALAGFITRGDLARHLSRASRVYRDRRRSLVQAMESSGLEVPVLGVAAGLHVSLEVADDAEVALNLRGLGWEVSTLSSFPCQPKSIASGLVVGFACLEPMRAREFAHDLSEVLG